MVSLSSGHACTDPNSNTIAANSFQCSPESSGSRHESPACSDVCSEDFQVISVSVAPSDSDAHISPRPSPSIPPESECHSAGAHTESKVLDSEVSLARENKNTRGSKRKRSDRDEDGSTPESTPVAASTEVVKEKTIPGSLANGSAVSEGPSTSPFVSQLPPDQFENLRKWILSSAETERRTGLSFSQAVRENPQFNNPAIYDKMLSYCDLDPHGTYFEHHVPLRGDAYYEQLQRSQDLQMKRRQNT